MGGAAGAAGANLGALRKLLQGAAKTVYEHVSGVFPGQNRPQHQAVGQLGGHVLEAMDGDVQLAVQEFLFQFLDEDAQAHAGQAGGLVGVSPGPDGVDLKIQVRAVGLQTANDHMVLDQGESAAAAPHFDGGTA